MKLVHHIYAVGNSNDNKKRRNHTRQNSYFVAKQCQNSHCPYNSRNYYYYRKKYRFKRPEKEIENNYAYYQCKNTEHVQFSFDFYCVYHTNIRQAGIVEINLLLFFKVAGNFLNRFYHLFPLFCVHLIFINRNGKQISHGFRIIKEIPVNRQTFKQYGIIVQLFLS